MIDNPVFVLSAGRSGSTLLQKLLNSNPELFIWGEHMGILRHFSNALREIESTPWIDETSRGDWILEAQRELKPERWTAWDGPFTEQQFFNQLKACVVELFCPGLPEQARWGFKELRYQKVEHVEFLMRLFPSAHLLLLLRHPVDACASHASAALAKEYCSSCEETTAELVKRIANDIIKPFFQLTCEVRDQFPRNSNIIFFENLIDLPANAMSEVRRILSLESSFDDEKIRDIMRFDLLSQRKQRPESEMEEYRRLARVFLEPEVCWYEKILGTNAFGAESGQKPNPP